ncbi:hypothetical protein LXM25_04645 [Dyadobacter sp. LJ53]|uniref:hypothetical protein n=1 Tax=Dyadobacter chenwenxiniae TaxID=2906456 RepID=UPI001F3E60AE|nr:hypothetical protein [Dyadobacter chenwenxiniae]MCF0049333.1 hypothetical protein [Dyadobacter chenwenxiniae]
MKILIKCICALAFVGAGSLIFLLISNWKDGSPIIVLSAWCLIFLLGVAQLSGALLAFQESRLGTSFLIASYICQIIALGHEGFAYLVTTGPYLGLKYDAISNHISIEASPFQIAYKVEFSADYSFTSINLTAIFIISILLSEAYLITSPLVKKG